LTGYDEAVAFMETRAAAIADGTAGELVWLVEHPPLYTAGTSADAADLVDAERFPVFKSGRGGEYTYHGPGQRVAYVMLDLKRRRQDVRAFVSALEEWIIRTLDSFNVRGERREDRVGVWVTRPDRPHLPDGSVAEDKIAAIGIRLRRWVSFHGISSWLCVAISAASPDWLDQRLGERIEHIYPPCRIEIAGRLVGEQHQRRVGDGARDRDALLFAAGKLGRTMLARWPICM
jgi:lipoate-protein ligase B